MVIFYMRLALATGISRTLVNIDLNITNDTLAIHFTKHYKRFQESITFSYTPSQNLS